MTKNRKLNKTREMVGRGQLTSLISISANLCTDSAVNKVKIDKKLLELLLNSRVTHLFLDGMLSYSSTKQRGLYQSFPPNISPFYFSMIIAKILEHTPYRFSENDEKSKVE
jgi:hypothetical protein